MSRGKKPAKKREKDKEGSGLSWKSIIVIFGVLMMLLWPIAMVANVI